MLFQSQRACGFKSLQRAREEIAAIRQAWGWNSKRMVAARFGPVLERWEKLLAREEETLAEQQAREGLVPNGYVAGNPLVKDSPLFKGRRDLFLVLERILAGPIQQRQPLLLYGQRRSGKTSVLHQLPVRLGPDYVPVFVDMQKLIERPAPDFPLCYDQAAVDRIVAATRGQPFLVQATCRRLVDLVNRERRQHATLANAEAALEALITADDTFYWREVWAGRDSDDAQRQVLLAMAQNGDGDITEDALVRQVGLVVAEKGVPRLVHREILERANEGYRFQVELMHRWVQRYGQKEKGSGLPFGAQSQGA
jgi:hypothetical protein